MATKIIALELGPQAYYPAGWYQDPATGQWYYYDEEGRRYVYVAGLLYPAVVWWPTPKVVNVKHGDALRIEVSFNYSGPAKTCKLRGEIGQKSVFNSFDNIVSVDTLAFTLAESYTPQPYNKSVDIPILVKPAAAGQLEGGKYYAIAARLIDGISLEEGKTGSGALNDAIFVVTAAPTFSDFKITDYKVA